MNPIDENSDKAKILENENNRLYDPDNTFIPSNSIFKQPLDDKLTIKEQSLKFFEEVIGNDDIKEQLMRSLLLDDKTINIMLVGPSATSKTLLLRQIENKCNKTVWYDCASGSTGAGLIELLYRNQDAKILILDEVSEMTGKNLDLLRGLLSDGRVSKTLKSQFINFRMKGLRIYATTNNPTKLSLPVKSRFQMYLIRSYSDSEFVKVMEFCLLKQNIIKSDIMAKELSWAMLKYNIRNIRTALSICSLVNEKDTIPDIKRVIENYLRNSAQDVNINYNQTDG